MMASYGLMALVIAVPASMGLAYGISSGIASIINLDIDFQWQWNVIGMEVVREGKSLLTATQRGFGKRTPLKAYRRQGRGGKGILNIKTTAKNGLAVSITTVGDDDEIIVMTASGKVIRQRVKEIKTTGRLAQGVRLIRMEEDNRLVSVINVPKDEAGEGGEGEK